MKNKIIALILTVVMATLALASCSSSYNYAEENLDEHVTFNADEFKAALKEIKIKDSAFTTDETTRQQQVNKAILASLASYATTKDNKKTEGAFGENDVLYYAYYTTYTVNDKDGNPVTYYFNRSEMKLSDYSSADSTTKSKHNISLSQVDLEDKDASDELANLLKKAIVDSLKGENTIDAYKTNATTGTSIKKTEDNKTVAAFSSVYVSFTRVHTKEDESTVTEKATYEKIDLTNAEDPLVALLLDANTTAEIGKAVKVKVDGADKDKFDLTVDGTKYTYSNFKVIFGVENEGKELVTFEYSPYTKDESVEPDDIHTTSFKVTIPKDKKLTYHVYPVYYYEVSEIDAESIIIEALGSKISTSYLDIFSSEEYKKGDKTVKALVEELVKIQGDKSEDENLKDLKTKYDDAAKVVKDAGTNATQAQKDAETAAKKAYNDAKDKAVAEKAAEILAATKSGAEAIDKVIVEEYKEHIYHEKKEAYDSEIKEKIAEEIWDLITKKVTIKTYPEALLKEAKDHLYNEYEYKFYNDKVSSSSTAESNYTAYNGVFEDYLVAVTKASGMDGVDAKIEAEAKKAIEPIIKLYVVAKAMASDADKVMLDQLKANAEAGIFDSGYEYSDDLSAEENEKLKKDADEAAKKYQDYVYGTADDLVVDDEAFEDYKNYYGKESTEQYVKENGETNVRAALQFDRLFDYFLSAKLEKSDDDDAHAHAEIAYENGKLAFYNIVYTLEDAEADADADK